MSVEPAPALPPGGRRVLTDNEKVLATAMFGDAIRLGEVTIRRRKWFPFQPQRVVMAPMGHIHFHPGCILYRDDFGSAEPALQALFLHEMTHVWQAQQRGRWYLPLMRHPFCSYTYTVRAGQPFERYGLEQQAEIVRHAFLARQGMPVPGSPGLAVLETILPF